MTRLYFARHAQPVRGWADDRTRPLTKEGVRDCARVVETLENIPLTAVYASPYRRAVDTVSACAAGHGLAVVTDERLRERVPGPGGITEEMIRRRWDDFFFHEADGESLAQLQARNVEAVRAILEKYADQSVAVGTHGAALSAVLHWVDPTFGCRDFLRFIDWMPYILRLDFEGERCVGRQELLIVNKAD